MSEKHRRFSKSMLFSKRELHFPLVYAGNKPRGAFLFYFIATKYHFSSIVMDMFKMEVSLYPKLAELVTKHGIFRPRVMVRLTWLTVVAALSSLFLYCFGLFEWWVDGIKGLRKGFSKKEYFHSPKNWQS